MLLRTILGLQRPQAGVVRIGGSDITQMSATQLRAVKGRYGVSFQQGALYSGLTVLQNVQLPMIEHLQLSAAALDELAQCEGEDGTADEQGLHEGQRAVPQRESVQGKASDASCAPDDPHRVAERT